MARKTIKELEEIIKDLENRLNEQYKINIELHNKISQMQDLANDSFENSTMYIQVGKEIEQLKAIIKLNETNIKAKEDTIKKQSHTIQKLLKDNEELKNNSIQELKDENKKHLEKIKELEENLHKSSYYKEGDYAIQALERGRIIEQQEKEIQKLKNENKLLKNNKPGRSTENKKAHNERGAGRKEKFSIQEKETMKMYRIQGKTIKEIAELYSCSVGLIHKIINE